jgi:hypothetical protein
MKRKPKLIILECTSESKEKMSEGTLLWELMRILGFGNRTKLLLIENKDSFLRKLERIQEPYLHISAHGDFDQAKGTRIDLPYKAEIYSSDLVGLWKKKAKSNIPRLIVLSACETGHIDMVRAFSDAGCQYCIAPLHETLWEDAALFSTLLYKLLIGERMSPWISFKKANIGISNVLPRLSGAWSFYEWGKKIIERS